MGEITLSDFVSLSVKWSQLVKILSVQLLLRVWLQSSHILLLSTTAVPDTRALRIGQNEHISPSLEHSSWREGRHSTGRPWSLNVTDSGKILFLIVLDPVSILRPHSFRPVASSQSFPAGLMIWAECRCAWQQHHLPFTGRSLRIL